METIILLVIGLLVAGILWRITKFIAKLVLVAVVVMVLYSLFFGGMDDTSPNSVSPALSWAQTSVIAC